MANTKSHSRERTARRPRKARRGSIKTLATDEQSMVGWQSIWFDLREHPWSSISIVPAGGVALTVDVAMAMAAVARRFEGKDVSALDATGVTIDDCRESIERIAAITARGGRAIVAVDDPLSSPTAIPLVRATSGAVLLVELELTSIRDARASIARLGGERFLGAVSLRLRRGRKVRGRSVQDPLIQEPVWSDTKAAATKVAGAAGVEGAGREQR